MAVIGCLWCNYDPGMSECAALVERARLQPGETTAHPVARLQNLFDKDSKLFRHDFLLGLAYLIKLEFANVSFRRRRKNVQSHSSSRGCWEAFDLLVTYGVALLQSHPIRTIP
jgi:hypothetical protein